MIARRSEFTGCLNSRASRTQLEEAKAGREAESQACRAQDGEATEETACKGVLFPTETYKGFLETNTDAQQDLPDLLNFLKAVCTFSSMAFGQGYSPEDGCLNFTCIHDFPKP